MFRSLRSWLAVAWLWPALALAGPSLGVVVYDAQGVPEVTVKRLLKSAEDALKEVGALEVAAGSLPARDAPRRCDDCAKQAAVHAGVPAVMLLAVRTSRKGLAVEASFWLDGERVTGPELGDTETDAAVQGLAPVLEAALPKWARKGYGGVRVVAPPGAVVKVDGRVADGAAGQVLPLPVGPHQVDVVFPDGRAELQKVEVTGGERVRLEPAPPATAALVKAAAPAESLSALRLTSYAAWTAGALLVAGGFIAGALSRGTASGSNPCTASSRDCIALSTASERARLSESYARTGNVLLGTGLGLATVGAGLFVLDLSFSSREPR